MPTPTKYASNGELYSKYNPRPRSMARYIIAHPFVGEFPKTHNIGRNAAKRAARMRSKALRARVAKQRPSPMPIY